MVGRYHDLGIISSCSGGRQHATNLIISAPGTSFGCPLLETVVQVCFGPYRTMSILYLNIWSIMMDVPLLLLQTLLLTFFPPVVIFPAFTHDEGKDPYGDGSAVTETDAAHLVDCGRRKFELVEVLHWLFGIESVFMCGLFTVLVQPRAYAVALLGIGSIDHDFDCGLCRDKHGVEPQFPFLILPIVSLLPWKDLDRK